MEKTKNKNSGIWFYIKSYKFNSILIRNFLLISVVVLVPIIVLIIWIYSYFNNVLYHNIYDMNDNQLSRIKYSVDSLFDEIDRLSMKLSVDNDICVFLLSSKEKDNDAVLYSYKNVFSKINSFNINNQYIKSIYVYSLQSNMVVSDNGNATLSKFFDQGWYQSYKEDVNKKYKWTVPRKVDLNGGVRYLSYISNISYFQAVSDGAVVINVDYDKLGQLIGLEDSKNYQDIYIIDSQGNIIYNNNFDKTRKNIYEIGLFDEKEIEKDNFQGIMEINNQRCVVSLQESNNIGWKYISVTSLKYYDNKLSQLRNFVMLFVLVCIFLVVIVAFFISVRIYKPLKHVLSIVYDPEGVEEQEEHKNSNEYKYIINNILKTFSSKKLVEEEFARRMVMLKKSQSLALQAQINPHFLYNTLEAINWMVMKMTGSKNEASAMITSLSRLLRISFDGEKNLVTLATEIEHVELYLEIQKTRYKDLFDIIWDIDRNMYDCMLVKLTLQPIIENCIYHGLKPNSKKGTITIKGKLDELVRIEICDDGVGMSESRLKDINDMMNQDCVDMGANIGIRSVNQRIKLVFGDEYGVSVRSEEGKGTTVALFFPMIK